MEAFTVFRESRFAGFLVPALPAAAAGEEEKPSLPYR
jgi:hypothetical protein